MFRLLQGLDVILFFPILALGFMSALSGGGLNPAFQRIGQLMIYLAPVTIVCVIVAEVLWRNAQPTIAYIVLIVPIVIWIGLILWLQLATEFFFKR